MRRMWMGLLVLFVLIGCSAREPVLKRPIRDDEFRCPPDETRYQQTPKWPSQAMDQDNLPKSMTKEKDKDTPTGLQRTKAGVN